MGITCGIDWAEGHHDVAVLDDQGCVLGRRKITTGVAGFSDLMGLLAQHTNDPSAVPVAIETDKNLIVVALQAGGFTVYPINPRAVARYRERHAQSGKSPTRATPPSWPTCCAPTVTSIGRCLSFPRTRWR